MRHSPPSSIRPGKRMNLTWQNAVIGVGLLIGAVTLYMMLRPSEKTDTAAAKTRPLFRLPVMKGKGCPCK